MNSLISGGALLSLFCGFIIIKKESKKQADYILSIILFILTLNYVLFSFTLIELFSIEKVRNFAPHIFGFSASLILIYGPLIYFYILAYTDRKHMSFQNSIYHFLPFILYNFLNVYYFLNDSIQDHNYLEEAYLNGHLSFFYLVTVLKGIHPIIYLFFTLRIVLHHQQYVKDLYSYDTSMINLKWMRYLVISMIVLITLVMILNIFRVGKTETIYKMAGEIITSFATIWVFTIGYYGVKKTPVFISLNVSTENKEKYQKTKLDEDNAEEIRSALIAKMEKDKPYLNPKLNISDLSEDLNFPSYQISQVLNDKIGMSFFDFVNNYRVEEIIKKMSDETFRQLTLLGNALESGFNSKASFNRIFKKSIGITPSEYYRQNYQK